MPEPKPWNNHI